MPPRPGLMRRRLFMPSIEGKFATAVTVPLADNPKALALAMKAVNEKKPAAAELSMIKVFGKEFTPIKERTWVETRRVNSAPKYRAIFHGASPKGQGDRGSPRPGASQMCPHRFTFRSIIPAKSPTPSRR